MNMKDVKAITIPEGSVKKIEDSNGNIIWGSYDAFPYRRLEYIHLNGAEYLWGPQNNKSGYYRRLDFDLERNNVRQMPIGIFDNQASNNTKRFYLADFEPTNGVRFCNGNTWSTAVALSTIPLNTKLRISAVNSTVNTKPRMQAALVNVVAGKTIIPVTTLDGTANTTITGILPYIGGTRIRATDGTNSLENPMKGKIYYYEVRANNYQGAFVNRRYPAQRKSDDKCGLYDVITGKFEVMYGTDTYQTAAGPTVDEYWDLTAPD